MYAKVFHIYGPLWINSYGLMIAIGFSLMCYLMLRHPGREKIITFSTFSDMVFIGLFAGIIGGRLLFVLENPDAFSENWLSIFFPWEGGFSMLGTMLALLMVLPATLWYWGVPILALLDIVAIYAPLLQAVSRIGCFLAGCCYGLPAGSSLPWAVTYSDPNSFAPLHIPLHPTQLYASIISLLVFFIMYGVLQHKLTKQGQLLCAYIALASFVRFGSDFWRWNRVVLPAFSAIGIAVSAYQVLAIGIFVGSMAGFCVISRYAKSS